jgi:hypothetical protein
MNRKAKYLIIVSLFFLANLIIAHYLHLNTVITIGDGDKAYYAEELPNLIRNIPTTLSYPLYRMFQPFIAVLLLERLHFPNTEIAMRVVSFCSYSILLIFFGYQYIKNRSDEFVLLSLILFPIFIVYQSSYHVELLYYTLCIFFLYYWDRYAIHKKTGDLLISTVLAVIAVITKEAFLIFYTFVILYSFLFYKKSTFVTSMLLMCAYVFVFYFDYYYLFESKSAYITNKFTHTVVSIRYGLFLTKLDAKSIMHSIFAYFMAFSGFGVYMIYLILKIKERKQMFFMTLLIVASVLLIYKIGFGSKYVFLLLGPFLFAACKKLKFEMNNFSIVGHYLITLALLWMYSWFHMQHLKL